MVHFALREGLFQKNRAVAQAVNGVSLTLERREIFGLVGESGCGKTTTAQAVLRLVDAQGGSVLLEGRDISAVPRDQLREVRRRVQIIYQDPYESLDPRFTVLDTVAEPMRIHGIGVEGGAPGTCPLRPRSETVYLRIPGHSCTTWMKVYKGMITPLYDDMTFKTKNGRTCTVQAIER